MQDQSSSCHPSLFSRSPRFTVWRFSFLVRSSGTSLERRHHKYSGQTFPKVKPTVDSFCRIALIPAQCRLCEKNSDGDEDGVLGEQTEELKVNNEVNNCESHSSPVQSQGQTLGITEKIRMQRNPENQALYQVRLKDIHLHTWKEEKSCEYFV